MALPAFSYSRAAINWGMVTKIEVRQQGTGTFLNVGRFVNLTGSVTPLSQESDPAGSQMVYALEYSVSFDLIQSSKTIELAGFIAGTSGTGLLETDAELKFTFADATTITLGAVTGYPMRIVSAYNPFNEDGARIISCSATVIETLSSLGGKIA